MFKGILTRFDLNLISPSSSVFLLAVFCFQAQVCLVGTSTAPSYAPILVDCPPGATLIRRSGTAANQSLSKPEEDYRRGRREVTGGLWKAFYESGPGRQTGYHSAPFFADNNQDDWPVLGLAHSGGGYRAALFGAGVVQALDAKTSSSPLGGILQLASYQAGLSGGSWWLTSLAAHNYPPVESLVDAWELEKDLVFPGGGLRAAIRDERYFKRLFEDAELKRKAGFPISLSDIWGRGLAYHFLPGTTSDNFYEASSPTDHGAGLLFSSLREADGIKKFQAPLPIIVADQLPPKVSSDDANAGTPYTSAVQGRNSVPLATPIYEFTPMEFGSFDPYLSAFTPTESLGTHLDQGKPLTGQKCTRAFDQMSFIMGTSASLFNSIVSGVVEGVTKAQVEIIKTLAGRLTEGHTVRDKLTARYPNPFKGVNGPAGYDDSEAEVLNLVDGGENGENIPLNPLLAPARGLDVIIAADGSADTSSEDALGAHWPNGASLINTFVRITRALPHGAAHVPPIPTDPKVWSSNGWSTRPTFFGCEPPSRKGSGGFPLIIYLPNSPRGQDPAGFHTNTSTFKLQYSKEESQAFLKAATATVINTKDDPTWPTCISCAMMDRVRNRRSGERSSICKTCFKRYCAS